MVSIIMTSFNREKYIQFAIESVLNQEYQDFELIIVDDASVDNTWGLINDYACLDNRIKIFQNPVNIGDYPNRNKAVSYAKGEYLMFLDSDDVMYKESIIKCVELMEKNPDCGFGISSFNLNTTALIKLTTEETIRTHFFFKPILMSGPGGTIHRLSYFREINSFPVKYGPANDMYHNIKAACFTNVIVFPFEVCDYRIHDEQESNNRFSYLYNNYNYLNDAIFELPLNLTNSEKKWIIQKNKRRLVTNLFKHYFSNFKMHEIHFVLNKTNFHFKDFLNGVFHLN